jgi:hypothetical protein
MGEPEHNRVSMTSASKPYVVLDSQPVHHPAGDDGIVVCSLHCQLARLTMRSGPVGIGTRWWKPQLSDFCVMVDGHDDDDDRDDDEPHRPGC